MTGLTNGVQYTFQVRAVNATGDGNPSDEASARTFPAQPANLAASPGDKLVSLTWDDPGTRASRATSTSARPAAPGAASGRP